MRTSSYLIYCISCSRCGMLYFGETGRCLKTRFGEHWRAVIGNDANQPVARHFNNGNHSVSDMVIRALCPISGSNNSRKCTSYSNLALFTLLVLMNAFPMSLPVYNRHWQHLPIYYFYFWPYSPTCVSFWLLFFVVIVLASLYFCIILYSVMRFTYSVYTLLWFFCITMTTICFPVLTVQITTNVQNPATC
jgi:hypothetical protein